MDERDNERTKAVVGDVSTYVELVAVSRNHERYRN